MKVFKFVSIVVILVVASTFTQTGSDIVSGCFSRVSNFVMARTVLIRAEGALAKAKNGRDVLDKNIRHFTIEARVIEKFLERLKIKLRRSFVASEKLKVAAKLSGFKDIDSVGIEDKNEVHRIFSRNMTKTQVRQHLSNYNREIQTLEAEIQNAERLLKCYDKNASDLTEQRPKLDDYISKLTTSIQELRLANELQKINDSVVSIRKFLKVNGGIINDVQNAVDRANAELEYSQQNQNSDELKDEINRKALIEVSDDDDLM
jgi:hypothetical protein